MGAETALILDANGHIAEGPSFNVFVVRDGFLRTQLLGCCLASRAELSCAEIGLSATAADVLRSMWLTRCSSPRPPAT
ncbi:MULTISPECIES: hypothetical protein [unclassified Mesorhizobium]|uniref:hypothetical protein n=1 Tax=unclassified Mesorhizobium TaxID=325217 RepID=UPI00333D6C64